MTCPQGSREYAKQIGRPAEGPHLRHDLPPPGPGVPGRPQAAARHQRRQPTEEELDRHLRGDPDPACTGCCSCSTPRAAICCRSARPPTAQASLKKIKEEIAAEGGHCRKRSRPSGWPKPIRATETALYDRLLRLCEAMDQGDPILNVPTYNGGLFITRALARRSRGEPSREQRIARFLGSTRCPIATWPWPSTGWPGTRTTRPWRWCSSTTNRWKSGTWARFTKGCWSSS